MWAVTITELVNVTSVAPAASRSVIAQPPPADKEPRAGQPAHGAPPPPKDGNPMRQKMARTAARAPPASHGASSPQLASTSCQII